MANTEELKREIQKEIEIQLFPDNSNNNELSNLEIEKFKRLALRGIEPDILRIYRNELIIGEITVSGFLRKKFHQGLNKKVTEAFAKFSIIYDRFHMHRKEFSFDAIHCLFITPHLLNGKNASDYFGWRNELFRLRVMEHKKVEIKDDLILKIESILKKASDEQKK